MRQISAQILDETSLDELASGHRLELVRGGKRIAEIVPVGEHSSSAFETEEIEHGEAVQRLREMMDRGMHLGGFASRIETSFTIVIKVTVDTNIPIYAVDLDSGPKHLVAKRAVDTLGTNSGVLPLQCLSEFYRAVTRKHLLAATDAAQFIRQLNATMEIIPSGFEDIATAMQWHQQHGIQFFDALLIATAQRAGCRAFFTEDMQNGRSLEGITLCNPFLLSPQELEEYLS